MSNQGVQVLPPSIETTASRGHSLFALRLPCAANLSFLASDPAAAQNDRVIFHDAAFDRQRLAAIRYPILMPDFS